MTNEEQIVIIQCVLGVEQDGYWGPITQAALDEVTGGYRDPETDTSLHYVKASSFADPADVEAFYDCKAEGNSDDYCFQYGDNGIGKWGHNTAQELVPMCALPYEDWEQAGKKGGDPVLVEYRGKAVLGILGDTMPHKENITNGCGIDLNPAYAKAFGLEPPFTVDGVGWKWVEPYALTEALSIKPENRCQAGNNRRNFKPLPTAESVIAEYEKTRLPDDPRGRDRGPVHPPRTKAGLSARPDQPGVGRG